MNEINKKEGMILCSLATEVSGMDLEMQLKELSELVESCGGEVVCQVIQSRAPVDPRTYISKGKIEEIRLAIENLEADALVVNAQLSGSQMRNLEEALDIKIVDRPSLILDLFAQRARSNEGVLQVKLAQLKYRLPRLVGYRDYLSRQGGGIGTRGPGEQQLEVDRRAIQREIDQTEAKLARVVQNREVTRTKRTASAFPVVSLVGYTNVGKSTILNAVLDRFGSGDKQVYADDRLFATLDTSVRAVDPDGGNPFLLVDTVGFVSNLPTLLVEAFKSTLEEVLYADLIVEVLDASYEDADVQHKITMDILRQIGADTIPRLTVFNKIDLGQPGFYASDFDRTLEMSARNPDDIDRLVAEIRDALTQDYVDCHFEIPYAQYGVLDQLRQLYPLISEDHGEKGTRIQMRVRREDAERFKEYKVDT